MKSSVIVFPGSNCDRDVAVALEKMQFKNNMVWHREYFAKIRFNRYPRRFFLR